MNEEKFFLPLTIEPPSSIIIVQPPFPNSIIRSERPQPGPKHPISIPTPNIKELNPNPIPLHPLPHFLLAPHRQICPHHLSTLSPTEGPEVAASAQGALVVGMNGRDAVARGEQNGLIVTVGCGRLLEE